MDEQIIINSGDRLVNEPWLVVFEGGSFNKTDLVLVKEGDGDIPLYQYQANYIKNGEVL